MSQSSKLKIYLAGPEVFLSHADYVFARKKELCDAAGFEGMSPFDNALDIPDEKANAPESGLKIAKANFDLMDDCDAVIANLSPFRGPSADAGTVGEIFYMMAKGKRIFAYSNHHGDYLSRVENRINIQNIVFDAQGMKVEDFGLWDNLMMPEAINRSGGFFIASAAEKPLDDLDIFEEVLKKIS